MHNTTITEAKASEAGALDGFSIRCEDCGPIGGASLRTIAETWAAEHQAYMTRKEAGR